MEWKFYDERKNAEKNCVRFHKVKRQLGKKNSVRWQWLGFGFDDLSRHSKVGIFSYPSIGHRMRINSRPFTPWITTMHLNSMPCHVLPLHSCLPPQLLSPNSCPSLHFTIHALKWCSVSHSQYATFKAFILISVTRARTPACKCNATPAEWTKRKTRNENRMKWICKLQLNG